MNPRDLQELLCEYRRLVNQRYYVLPHTRRKLEALRRLGAPVQPIFWFSEDCGPWLILRFALLVLITIATGGYIGVVLQEFFSP